MGNKCHIYTYERGGASALGSIFPHVIGHNKDGTFDLKELEARIPIVVNEHLAKPDLICMENSQGCFNGAAIPLQHVHDVKKVADKFDLKMHLDGARLLNALITSGDDPKVYAEPFRSVSFCFSKGMGCPIGSVLVGSKEDMVFAKDIRKMLGGGMRQAGILASCMQVAMEDWREKLTEDNENCLWMANEMNAMKELTVDMSTV
jgi:threonine aldolase